MTLLDLIRLAMSSDPDPEGRVQTYHDWERQELLGYSKEIVALVVAVLAAAVPELFDSSSPSVEPIVAWALGSLIALLVATSWLSLH